MFAECESKLEVSPIFRMISRTSKTHLDHKGIMNNNGLIVKKSTRQMTGNHYD